MHHAGESDCALERAFLEADARPSPQRICIIRALAEADGHPTVDELVATARRSDPAISRSTVYRLLAQLHALGLVHKYDFAPGKSRYEDATRGSHPHAVDLETGEIRHLSNEEAVGELADRLGKLAAMDGCHLQAYVLTLFVSAEPRPGPGRAIRTRKRTYRDI
jgi:Fur family ferric uptake transcriptional regulator